MLSSYYSSHLQTELSFWFFIGAPHSLFHFDIYLSLFCLVSLFTSLADRVDNLTGLTRLAIYIF